MEISTRATWLATPAYLRDGARWCLRSGIQEPGGGVARNHHTHRGVNARVSTEITGYFVSSALDLYERTGNAALLDAARRAGDFLAERAWDEDCGAMPFEWAEKHDAALRYTYFFDNGIIVRGLIRLWRTTGKEKLLEVAVKCGESMRSDFVNGREIDPILELPSKAAAPWDSRWSRRPGCYQLKSALGWLALAEATGQRSWVDDYDFVYEQSLRSHTTFVLEETGHRVMDRLHAYCYFLEALLARADRPEAAWALGKGIARAAYEFRRLRAEFERSDTPAQLLRVRLWAAALGAVPLAEKEAEEEAGWAAQYQMTGEAIVDGGFCFGRRDGAMAPFVSPVSTAFCLQALALWDDYRAGRPLAPWPTMV